jgi:hypothetical protein
MANPIFIFQQIMGWTLLAASIGTGFCMILLKSCVDPQKVREAEDAQITRLIRGALVPKKVLTPTGVKLWKTRNILAVVAAISLAVYAAAIRFR